MRRHWLHTFSAMMSLALVAVWIAGLGTLRDSLRESSFDIVYRWLNKPAAESPVIVIDIDRETLVQYGAWPWPRMQLAQLIEAVAKAKPSAIGIDILLGGKVDTGHS